MNKVKITIQKLVNKLKSFKSLSRATPAIVFAIVFAGIGTYILISSYAASSTLTNVWSTNATWDTGTLSNVAVANNSVTLAAQNVSSAPSTTSSTPSTPNTSSTGISSVGVLAKHNGYLGSSTYSTSVSPHSVGDLLVLGVVNDTWATSVSSVSGGGVSSWQKATSVDYDGPDGQMLQYWYGTVTSTSSSTLTVKYGASINNTYIAVQEFSDGAGASWSVDTTKTSATPFPSLTASSSGELYVGMGFAWGNAAAGTTSGVSYNVVSSSFVLATDTDVSGTISPAGTGSGSLAVLFKAVSSTQTTTTTTPPPSTTSSTPSTPNTSSTGISSVGVLAKHNGYLGSSTYSTSVSPHSVGDLLVLGVVNDTWATSVSSVSGGGVSSWQKATSVDYDGPDGQMLQYWYGTVTSTSSSTLTVKYGASINNTYIAVQEFSDGAGASWSVDTTKTSATPFPSLTASSSGELYVGMGFAWGNAAAGTTSGVSYNVVSSSFVLATDTDVSGTISPAGTGSGSLAVLFKAVSSTQTTTTTTPPPSSAPSTISYVSTGNITLDYNASAPVSWSGLTFQDTVPTGTTITSQVRTSTNNSTWSAWTSNISQAANSQYIQIQVTLTTSNSAVTPTLSQLTLSYTVTTPAPTVTLSASPTTITSGQTSTLSWSSTNTTSCTASGAWSGSLVTSGSQSSGALTQTETYNLSCSGSGGSASASATVTVSLPSGTGSGSGSSSSGSGMVTPASYFTNSVTNQLATSWPVDANSAAAVSGALGLLGSGSSVSTWINDNRSIFVVPSTQPEVLMAEGTPTNGQNWCGSFFSDNDANSAAPPTGNYNSLFYAPIPSGVYYSTASTDDEVAVLQQGSSPQEYDFWLFGEGGTPTGSGDQTYPGKIIDPFYSSGSPNPDVSLWDVGNGGQLSTSETAPDFPNGCGDSASGLSVAATTITEQDVYNAENDPSKTGGGIDHALSLEIPYQLCDGDRWPATNPYPDCTQSGTVLQEGDYFRLSSAANCTALKSDGAPPLAFMVCYALQNYGMIIMDRNTEPQGTLILEGEDPADWTTAGNSGTDPFTASMGGAGQGGALSDIPWNDLQLVDPPQS